MFGVFNSEDAAEKKFETPAEGYSYAYINSDTLSARYDYIADRAEALARREGELQVTLQEKVQKLEARFAQLQQKADIMTRAELEAAQNEIQAKEAEINEMRLKLSQQLDQERIAMQLDLYNKVEDVLKGYAGRQQLQTIFSYTQGGQLLYINPELDITNTVLEELNKRYAESKNK